MWKYLAIFALFSLHAESVDMSVRSVIKETLIAEGLMPQGKVMTSRNEAVYDVETATILCELRAEHFFPSYELSFGFGGAQVDGEKVEICSLFDGWQHFVALSYEGEAEAARDAIYLYKELNP